MRGVVGVEKLVASRSRVVVVVPVVVGKSIASLPSFENERLLLSDLVRLARGRDWWGSGSAGVVGVTTLAVDEDDVDGLFPSSPSRMCLSDFVDSELVSSVRWREVLVVAGADRYDATETRD